MSSFLYIFSMGKRHLHVLLDQTPNTKLTSLGLDKNHERASGAEVGVILLRTFKQRFDQRHAKPLMDAAGRGPLRQHDPCTDIQSTIIGGIQGRASPN